jgi:hypothetical protein
VPRCWQGTQRLEAGNLPLNLHPTANSAQRSKLMGFNSSQRQTGLFPHGLIETIDASAAAHVAAPALQGRDGIQSGCSRQRAAGKGEDPVRCSSMVSSGGVHTGGDDLDEPTAAHLRLLRPPPIRRPPRPAPTGPSSLRRPTLTITGGRSGAHNSFCLPKGK